MTCNNCQQLQAENDILRRRILKLEQLLTQALYYCTTVKNQANYILSHKSGISRGQWAYSRGAGKIATKVIDLLSR